MAPEVFDAIPKKEKYIFQGQMPSKKISKDQPAEGHGIKKSKLQFTHKLLAQEPLNTTGGQVRIADSKGTFPLSKTIAAAHLLLQPNAMREMHWHPQADEWSFFIRGRARVTIFASEGTARTFDYGPGDVGIVPKNMGHFIENLSDDEEVEVLEIFRSDEFLDFSLFDWMGKSSDERETPQCVRQLFNANTIQHQHRSKMSLIIYSKVIRNVVINSWQLSRKEEMKSVCMIQSEKYQLAVMMMMLKMNCKSGMYSQLQIHSNAIRVLQFVPSVEARPETNMCSCVE